MKLSRVRVRLRDNAGSYYLRGDHDGVTKALNSSLQEGNALIWGHLHWSGKAVSIIRSEIISWEDEGRKRIKRGTA